MKYLLAHDLGTSGDKVALFQEDGKMVSSVITPYETFYGDDGVREQDPNDWWAAVCQGTKQLMKTIDPKDVAGISFGGMGHCCTCLDKEGNFLGRSILWSDVRSHREQKELEELVGAKKCYEVTGHKPSSSYTITKMMWVKKNQPEIYEKTYKVLTAKDVIVYKLTGRMCTDYSDAGGYMAYNYRTKQWDREMIEACGLEMSLFPEVVSGIAVAGTVTKEAAEATGLAEGTPVVPGGMDGGVAGVGRGTLAETGFHLGTSSGASLNVPADVLDEQQRYEIWCNIDNPDEVSMSGSMNAFGGSIAWMRDNLCAEEAQLAAQTGKNIFDFINENAAKSPVGARGLIYLPYLQGERSPYFNAKARGCFIGLTMQHTANDMKRAVMEGSALHLALMMKQLEEISGKEAPKKATISGGASKSKLVCQIMADVMNCEMLNINVSDEVGSLGAAICAGVGVGIFKDFSVANQFVEITGTTKPIPENVKRYQEILPLFEKSYAALEPIFEEIHE